MIIALVKSNYMISILFRQAEFELFWLIRAIRGNRYDGKGVGEEIIG